MIRHRMIRWGILCSLPLMLFTAAWVFWPADELEVYPLGVPVPPCTQFFKCKSVIRNPTHDRTLETVFEDLRAAAKAGQCSGGIWQRVEWDSAVLAEPFEIDAIEMPDSAELQPAICEALAAGEWRFRVLNDYGSTEMVAVWQKTEPPTGFRGALVMYARRPSPNQPYEVTRWRTYARLYLSPDRIRQIITPVGQKK